MLSNATGKATPLRRPIFIFVAFVALLGVALAYWAKSSSQVVLLASARGANWIRRDEPFDLAEKTNSSTYSFFLNDYNVPAGVPAAVLRVMALRRVVVRIDGKQLFDNGATVTDWEQEYLIPIPRENLSAGKHRLQLLVANRNGPSLVRADCAALGIRTGDDWKASADRTHWSAAVNADKSWEPALSSQVETAQSGFTRLLPLLIVLFATGVLVSLFVLDSRADRLSDHFIQRWESSASRIRWLLLAAWAVLAINNLSKLPTYVGYDSPAHFDYIQYIAQHGWIPLPDRGGQFFQTPMYYIVSALLYRLLALFGADQASLANLLRIVPFACGAAMVQICYLCAGDVFKARADLRALTTVVGSLVPMNLYMAQSLSNEPMAACADGLLILVTLRFLSATGPATAWSFITIGLVYALAVLTKISAIVWIAPVLLVVIVRLWSERATVKIWGRVPLIPFSALCLAAPYLIRNRVATGQWIYSNTQLAGVKWWQDPGFRTPANLWHFGHAFSHPAYSGFGSVWDSLYSSIWSTGWLSGVIDYAHRPPWNYGLMSCGLWISVFPMLLLIVGGARSLFGRFIPTTQSMGLLFSLAGLLAYIPAIFYVYLTLPIYTCAKGSYMLGAVPCAAMLIAWGFEPLTRNRAVRTVAIGGIFTWAVTSYLAFFIF